MSLKDCIIRDAPVGERDRSAISFEESLKQNLGCNREKCFQCVEHISLCPFLQWPPGIITGEKMGSQSIPTAKPWTVL